MASRRSFSDTSSLRRACSSSFSASTSWPWESIRPSRARKKSPTPRVTGGSSEVAVSAPSALAGKTSPAARTRKARAAKA